MQFRRSKEWWLARIAGEPCVPIGAGVVPNIAAHSDNGAFYTKAPLSARFWQRLGFHGAGYPDPKKPDGIEIRDTLFVRTDFTVSLLGRLRIAISGKIQVATAVHCENPPGYTVASANLEVLQP